MLEINYVILSCEVGLGVVRVEADLTCLHTTKTEQKRHVIHDTAIYILTQADEAKLRKI